MPLSMNSKIKQRFIINNDTKNSSKRVILSPSFFLLSLLLLVQIILSNPISNSIKIPEHKKDDQLKALKKKLALKNKRNNCFPSIVSNDDDDDNNDNDDDDDDNSSEDDRDGNEDDNGDNDTDIDQNQDEKFKYSSKIKTIKKIKSLHHSDYDSSSTHKTHHSLSLNNWWCDLNDEYAWLGFSYDVSDCQTREQMINDFDWMRSEKGARYVRLYGGCDKNGFDNDVIEAASEIGVGIYALIWFGFDGDDKWKGRKARLLDAIKSNPKAPYYIRAVTCGSEPLYDNVLPLTQMVEQIKDLQKQLKPYKILVTLSEMPAGYKKFNDAPEIFKQVDFVSIHSFPFFDGNATTAKNSLPVVNYDIKYAKNHSDHHHKKIVITQTGWPSNSKVWPPNSKKAVVNLQQEKDFFDLLNDQCLQFKRDRISWFSHIYNDTTLPGWGVIDGDGQEKFAFNPRSHC